MYRFVLCLIIFMYCVPGAAQENPVFNPSMPDIDTLVFLGKNLVYDHPDSSLIFSYQAYEESLSQNYYWGKINASQWIAEAYYMKGVLDSSDIYNQYSLDIATEQNDLAEIANSRVMIAAVASRRGEHQDAIDEYIQAKYIMEVQKDTNDLIDVHIRIGHLYFDKDELESAALHYDTSLYYSRIMGDKSYEAYNISAMSLVQKKMGNVEAALDLVAESLGYFESVGDNFSVMMDLNNRAIIYKNQKKFNQALSDYLKVDSLADATGNPYFKTVISGNLGIVYNELQQYEKAEEVLQTAIKNAASSQSNLDLGNAKASLARTLYKQKKYNQAIVELTESLALSKSVNSLEKQLRGYEVGKEIYVDLNNFQRALDYTDSVQMIKDSIFQIDKAKQVDELQTKYETEKKDSEIKLLNSEASINTLKLKAISIGSVLGLLSLISLIFGLYHKRKKEKLLWLKEKEIEDEKRKRLEIELAFKQKELTAKVLQLASKNEFLQELELEVNELQSTIDTKVNMTSKRISRMIQSDSLDEEMWTQFSKEFSGVHQGFIDKLTLEFGSFTKSEIRLLSLLKMNLSSKDMANILRISDEGIKKARYRLRKKMRLESDVNLQSYIISF